MSNINWGNLLFGFSGRINRAKWWLTVLITVIVNILVSVITNAVQSTAIIGIIGLISFVAMFWISLAAGVKRLHDLNRTGAWLIYFILGPFSCSGLFAIVGLDVMAALCRTSLSTLLPWRVGTTAIIVGVLALILYVWAFVWFGCLRGTVGPNQYGPDPLEGRV
jgi:uncharacterized membrane protein YhaH (DUF805 family)